MASFVAVIVVVLAVLTALVRRYEAGGSGRPKREAIFDLPPEPGPDWGKSKSIGPNNSNSKIISVNGNATASPSETPSTKTSR